MALKFYPFSDHGDLPDRIAAGDQLILRVQTENFRILMRMSAEHAFDQRRFPDVIADLTEDLAAEQKARVTYDNILRLSDDPDVNNVIKFLRQREINHFQRFGDTKLAKRVDFQTEDNIFVQIDR